MSIWPVGALKTAVRRYPKLRIAFAPAIAIRRYLTRSVREKQREVLENLSHFLVGDPVLRIDEFQGVFALDSRSDLFKRIVQNRYYEPGLARLCMELLDPEKDVVDVGANVGFYSVFFAKQLARGRVLAVEPTHNALRRLRQNIALNGVADKVIVFEGVASNVSGTVEIKTIPGREEYSTLGELAHPVVSGSHYILQSAASTTIDYLIEHNALNPGLIKVDIEGGEHLLLEGAKNTLSLKRPIVVSELSDVLLRRNGSSAMDVVNLIKSYDYDVVDAHHPDIPPGRHNFADIVCTPREKRRDLINGSTDRFHKNAR